MTRQTTPGVVEGANHIDGRMHYDVRLTDGTRLAVSRRLIVPEPAAELPPGTPLLVEHNGATVIAAQRTSETRQSSPTRGAATPSSETHHARIVAADQASGALTVTWGEGDELRVVVSPGRQIWAYLHPGAEILVEQSRDLAGKDTWRLRRPPAGGPQPPPVVGRHAVLSQRAQTVASLEPPTPPESLAMADDAAFDEDVNEPPSEPEPERPIVCPEMAPIFGDGGAVARLLGERYRLREGQLLMANLVRDALQECRHAVLEAGTGIGKSFAYLVPIIWSGARALISTSNKALMSQLWRSDLPALAKIAPRSFKMALLKGRSNYVCVRRLDEFAPQRRLPGLAGDLERVEDGLRRVRSGDVEEMGLTPAQSGRFTVDHRACEGMKCPRYGDCLYERAKSAAQAADIVVTNHALLCFSLLRYDNQLLPIRPVLVIDEAHELESYAINALTQLLEYETLAAVVNHPLAAGAADNESRQQAMECNHGLFQELLSQRPDRWSQRWALHGELQQGLALTKWLTEIRGKVATRPVDKDAQGQRDSLVLYADELLATVRALANPEPETAIRYCDLPEEAGMHNLDKLQVQYRPLEVAVDLKRTLFDAWPRVICTSATLSINRDLGWFLRRAGLQEERTPPIIAQTIPSPFDYRNHVLLYTPHGLAPVYGTGEAQYVERLTAEVRRLVETSRGRAFVLCTSRKRMLDLYDRLAPVLNYPCFCQGKGYTRHEMLERFKASGEAVLFGTRSFWEGVDIPGEALSLVILDKLPFLPHTDPVLQRQEQLVAARGGDPFEELQVSHAALTLRQGAGRLIRTETDRGVIAVLDSRIVTNTTYGPKIIRTLPGGKQTMRFESVQAFFARG
jgi:ATP-dependent DNA helicase DinG